MYTSVHFTDTSESACVSSHIQEKEKAAGGPAGFASGFDLYQRICRVGLCFSCSLDPAAFVCLCFNSTFRKIDLMFSAFSFSDSHNLKAGYLET